MDNAPMDLEFAAFVSYSLGVIRFSKIDHCVIPCKRSEYGGSKFNLKKKFTHTHMKASFWGFFET